MTAATSHRRWIVAILCFVVPAMFAAPALAADAPRTKLPDEKPHQKALRDYLGTLAEKDFDHGVKEPIKVVAPENAEEAYKLWALGLDILRVGSIMHGYRNAAGTALPASQFLLATIEDPTQGVLRPAIWPEPTAWLANWDNAGNPYHKSRALKMRAFVTASVDMLMFDERQENSDAPLFHRADWFGPHLLMYGYVGCATRDAVGSKGREAYNACLKGMMKRVAAWGPRRDESYLDITAMVGMRFAADSIGDKESMKLAEDYAHRFFDDPWLWNPAGYFPEQGCLDAGFNGLSLYYATWLTLAAPDWTFVRDHVKEAWRLRAHLVLPEPDGKFTGPSHFNSRTGTDASADQWDWRFRTVAASYLTEQAICQAPFPTDEQLKAAPEKAVGMLQPQVMNYPDNPNMQRTASGPWRWMLYPNAPDFPMNNFALEFYPKGFLAEREKLVKKDPSLLKYPFERDEDFTAVFGNALLAAKRKAFGVIVHTGPVSEFQGEGHGEFTGPYGLSGGGLSAFWTPETGAVILGRRAGMQFPDRKPPSFDLPEAWRTWPVHAVSGQTAAGKFFTSARNQEPQATFTKDEKGASVKVTGVIPAAPIGAEKSLAGKIEYARAFTVEAKGLKVETAVTGDGADSLAELYEVIPVYIRNAMGQAETVTTAIEFEAGGKWSPATEQYAADVAAVRLTRFKGSVVVRFDRPRRVKLAPTEWVDTFMTRATCRNVLVDLLESGDKPAAVKEARKVGYMIEAEKK
ncbi:MAG: hypothetical protein NTW19_03590 [Planctomycetota bacterium]|nr:hypothetical protein [Planctomycetota bacterium]